MTIPKIKELIISHGGNPVTLRANDQRLLQMIPNSGHPELIEYITQCICSDGVDGSGIGLLGWEQILEENADGVTPGGFLKKYGYIVIAVSVGGNAIVVDANKASVFWADKSRFSDTSVFVEIQGKGKYCELKSDPNTVRLALLPLESCLSTFLVKFLNDEYTEMLDALD